MRVQRKRTKGYRLPPNTVYVGRPTKWGNPFVAEHGLTRAVVVDSFRHVFGSPTYSFVRAGWADELRGKDLACWCPLVDKDGNRVPCHADVLLEWANGETGELRVPDREDV